MECDNIKQKWKRYPQKWREILFCIILVLHWNEANINISRRDRERESGSIVRSEKRRKNLENFKERKWCEWDRLWFWFWFWLWFLWLCPQFTTAAFSGDYRSSPPPCLPFRRRRVFASPWLSLSILDFFNWKLQCHNRDWVESYSRRVFNQWRSMRWLHFDEEGSRWH